MLNTRGIFHPQFYYHPRPSVNTAQVARVEVYRPSGVDTRHWEPGGFTGDPVDTLIWRSQARLQPNNDWRARPKEIQGEFEAIHAVRVQLPIGGNEIGDDMGFFKDDRVLVIASPVIGAEYLIGDEFFVRNAVNSANLWVHNLLCDLGTKQQDHSGN